MNKQTPSVTDDLIPNEAEEPKVDHETKRELEYYKEKMKSERETKNLVVFIVVLVLIFLGGMYIPDMLKQGKEINDCIAENPTSQSWVSFCNNDLEK